MTDEPAIASPCVRNCCLDEEDICIGCHRSVQEIIDWGDASEEQKRCILKRVAERVALKEKSHP